jgi:thymidine phosphorylase
MHVACWHRIEKGMPLFTVHAETPGELQYALSSLSAGPDIFTLEPE